MASNKNAMAPAAWTFFYLQPVKYNLLLLTIMLFPLVHAEGQGARTAQLLDCIELENGANNLMINGRPYITAQPQAEGHPYFGTKEWKAGTIYIKGKAFAAHKLRYNLIDHQLIIKHERPNGTSQSVILSDAMVDSFQMDEDIFVNRTSIRIDETNEGFVEKIFADHLSFYRFQRKVFGARTNATPFGKYSTLKDIYFLLINDSLYRITQKKDFLNCFPEHKIDINKYLKTNSLKWQKLTKTEFVELLKFCNDQM